MKALKKLNLKKVILCYILIYFIIAGMYCGINGTRRMGEWDDYTFPAVTLITKQNISISEDDLLTIKEYYPEWSDAIDNTGINNLSGLYTRNGGMLTWYFPTYAIVCIPMILFLKFLGLPVIYAFSFTNLMVIMIMLLLIYKFLKINDRIKFLLILSLSLNPVVFYYCWPSGEVLIYSLLGIGFIFWYNGCYKRAALFVSLAGTLNTTIMSIGIIMIIEYMIKLLKNKSKDITWIIFVKKNFFAVIKYGLCYVIGLCPMIYFYYNTGYINLTASRTKFTVGAESVLQRTIAYIFDLNYGIFPYFPICLLVGSIMFLCAICYRKWRYIEWFITFIINVILYSFMVHINSGMSGIARYNIWGVIILLFAECVFLEEIIKKIKLRKVFCYLISINICLVTIIIYCYGPTGANRTSYMEWTPIAAYVLNECPILYNPLHSTFYNRTAHKDGVYEFDTPVVYQAEDGYVRKILASFKDKDVLLSNYTSTADKEKWFIDQVSKLTNQDTYISIPKKYEITKCGVYNIGYPVYFDSANFNANEYVIAGLSEQCEDWGTWTDGNEFIMRLKTSSESELLHGKIVGSVYNGQQSISIYVNDRLVYEGIAKGQNIEFDFSNPGINKVIEIKIEMPEAISPLERNESQDARKLALGLSSITIYKKQIG